jgi:ABC-type multidrug transport system fused ATPase/permease subunit
MSSTYQTELNDIKSMNLSDASLGPALQNLNDKLSTVTTSLTQLTDVKQNALSKQNDVKNIVDSESKRLADKKEVIDNAMETQKRIIYFNDNSRKRYSAYLNIVVTSAILFFVLFLLRVLQVQLTFIPEFVFIISYIVAISTGLIIIYNVYSEIRKHNLYNFDELNFNGPPTPTTSPGGVDASGNSLFGINLGCVGESCCDEGTSWDKNIGKCVNPALTESGAATPTASFSPASSATTAASASSTTVPVPTLTTTQISNLYNSLNSTSIDYTNTKDYGAGFDIIKEGYTSSTKPSVTTVVAASTASTASSASSSYVSPLDSFEFKEYTSYK